MIRVVSAVLLSACYLLAADSPEAAKQKLIGTWRLVSYIREEIPSGAKSNVMGSAPSGYLRYSNDGRMIVLFVGTGHKKPAGAVATTKEAEALFRDMVSYAGTFAVEGDAIIHHVDVSWNQSWTGTDQKRFYKLDGDRLSLATTPSLDPIQGRMSVRTLIWQRLK